MEKMELLLKQIEMLSDEPDGTAALANVSAALKMALPDANWTGFYVVRGKELVVGPFQGKPACTHIPFDRGVCGKCWRTKETQRVDDVTRVKDHIACDSASRSELCVPVIVGGEVILIMDLDAPVVSYFDETIEKGMEDAAEILAQQAVRHAWHF
jgi:GAF domain-containing protein